MEKLEFKHVANYLPYGLKINRYDKLGNLIFKNTELHYLHLEWISQIKPILRPLSDLTKEIEHNGKKFVPIDVFEITDDHTSYLFEYDSGNIKLISDLESISTNDCEFDINFIPFEVVQKLISWHFDIFGLIKKGLAIDINNLK